MEYVKCGDDTIPEEDKMFCKEDKYPKIFEKFRYRGFNIVYGNIKDKIPKLFYYQHRNEYE